MTQDINRYFSIAVFLTELLTKHDGNGVAAESGSDPRRWQLTHQHPSGLAELGRRWTEAYYVLENRVEVADLWRNPLCNPPTGTSTVTASIHLSVGCRRGVHAIVLSSVDLD